MKHRNVFLKNCLKAIWAAPIFIAVLVTLSTLSAKIAISKTQPQRTESAVLLTHTAHMR